VQTSKILLVDDHALFRQGVRTAIELDGEFEVAGEAADGGEALAQATRLRPDLILMDINMPNGDGIDALRAIKRELPETKIVMLTVYDSDDRLLEAVKSGADGFLSKNARSQAVLEAARGVLKGEAAISKYKVTKLCVELGRLSRLESGRVSDRLTPRETQILQKIAEGLSNKEIARAFVLSESTVKTHVSHILEKLQVRTRYQAAAYAQGSENRQKSRRPPHAMNDQD
jgi:DNA-binding NarL/FixJ family response regulator